jgi:hypothetical protein
VVVLVLLEEAQVMLRQLLIVTLISCTTQALGAEDVQGLQSPNCIYKVGVSGETAILFCDSRHWNCELTGHVGSLSNFKCGSDFKFNRVLTIDNKEGLGFFEVIPCRQEVSFPNFCEQSDAC